VHEVFFHEVAVFPDRLLHGLEDHALGPYLLQNGLVHDLGVHLGPEACQGLLLRLGEAQSVERLFDLLGELVPAFHQLHGAGVVGHLVEIDL